MGSDGVFYASDTAVEAAGKAMPKLAKFSEDLLAFSEMVGNVDKKHKFLTAIIRLLVMYVIIIGCVLADGGMSEQVSCYYKNEKCPWQVGVNPTESICTIEDVTELKLDYSTKIYKYTSPVYLAILVYLSISGYAAWNVFMTNSKKKKKLRAQAAEAQAVSQIQTGLGGYGAINPPAASLGLGRVQGLATQAPTVAEVTGDDDTKQREYSDCVWTTLMHLFGCVCGGLTVVLWTMRYAHHIDIPWWGTWLSTLIFLALEFARFCVASARHRRVFDRSDD